MELNGGIARLIQSNLIKMVERNDIKSLQEFKNNSARMQDLMLAMGASDELLEQPAHLAQLEACLKQVIDGMIEGMQNQKNGSGYQIRFDDDNKLKTRIENFSTQDDYELQITKSGYRYRNVKLHSSLGTSSQTVQGSIPQRDIMVFRESERLLEKEEDGRKLLLDDSGFVIEELDASRSTIQERVPGQTSLEKRIKSNSSRISRNGSQINTRAGTVIDWNGDPLNLNDKEEEKSNVYKRALITVARCPASKKYYEEVLSLDVEKMLKKIRTEK